MQASYDLFFSYRRHDLPRAASLLEALQNAGLRVWRDQHDIPDHAAITQEIRTGLAHSKALLAFYSASYPQSRPCQQELVAAWLAAQQQQELPFRRVLVLNPELGFAHLPTLLREQQIPRWTDDVQALAASLRDHVSTLEGTLASAAAPSLPTYYGMAPVEAPRFVGRVRQFWDLHGQLTANRLSIITGVQGQAVTQVRGLGGNGKSLLAREYAVRFGSAYPGGVFWLNAYGHDDTKGPLSPEARAALRQNQLQSFALQLGLPVAQQSPAEVEAVFWRQLERAAQPCLWIVDDLPSGLSQTELEQTWQARWPGAATLFTTRSRTYGAVGQALDLEVLVPDEALQLLTSRRPPQGSLEQAAAQKIAEVLGYHPLALEVAASYLRLGTLSYAQYLAELARVDQDAVEFGAVLQESLPTGHERSISATLLKSIRSLGAEGLDLLRLAAVLAVAPIPVSLISEVFAAVGAAEPIYTVQALDQAEALSLSEPVGDTARQIHSLISRTLRFQVGQDERSVQMQRAAVRVLAARLEVVMDIREHSRVAHEVVHARYLISGEIATMDEADLVAWVGRHDYERGEYGAARQLQEQAFEVSQRLLGPEHSSTLTAMGNLAQTRHAQGDLAGARQLQEQVLQDSQRLLGPEHSFTLTAMNNLALTRQAQGDLAGARQLQEQVLELMKRLLGPEHPDTLRAVNNLAQMRTNPIVAFLRRLFS